jgi:hypothetical protein
MDISLAKVTRLAVFVHPGQLKNGCVFLVALCDADEKYFEESYRMWKADKDAICLYDGPPQDLSGTPPLEGRLAALEARLASLESDCIGSRRFG